MQAGVGFDDLRVIHSSMKCIRFDVCKVSGCVALGGDGVSSMKCIRFDVCKGGHEIRKPMGHPILNEVHTF